MGNPDELKAIIKQALAEAREESEPCGKCCGSCTLNPQEHAEHHDLLKGAFSLRSRVINTVVTSVVCGGLVWFGLAVWEKLVRQVKG